MIYKQIQGLMLNIFLLFGIKALPLARLAVCDFDSESFPLFFHSKSTMNN